ncbi:MAG: hypothetical protein AAFZ15_26755 [Bacteroidota bacterium]
MKKIILLTFLSLCLIQCQSDKNQEAQPNSKVAVNNNDKFDTVPSNVNYVMAIPIGDDIRTLKNELTSYSTANGYTDLRVGHIFLEDNKKSVVPIIIYRRFENMELAKNYSDFLKTYNAGKAFKQAFPISQANYRVLLKNKNVESYLTFYEKNIVAE